MINASLSAGQLKNDTVFQVIQALFSPQDLSHTHTKDTHTYNKLAWSHIVDHIVQWIFIFGQFFSLLFMFLLIIDSMISVVGVWMFLCQSSNLKNKMKHRFCDMRSKDYSLEEAGLVKMLKIKFKKLKREKSNLGVELIAVELNTNKQTSHLHSCCHVSWTCLV